MAGSSFDFRVGKELARKHEEAARVIARIEDRVRRNDLEAESRFAGTLLAALSTAERSLRDAPDVTAWAAAGDIYAEKLERASACVFGVHERVLAPSGSAG